jgi:transposase
MTSENKLKERQLIVKLHFIDKKKTREIANLLGTSKSTVSYWICKHKKGLSLEDKSRSGRPAKIDSEKLEKLKLALHKKPISKRFGGQSMGWTTKMVVKYIQDEFQIQYTQRNVIKLLHKLGLSLITPRSQHIKDSKLARQVFKDDMGKKTSKSVFWIYANNV